MSYSVVYPHAVQPGKGCYRCLFPQPPPPGLVPSCAEAGVLGALCGLVGSVQATETKYLKPQYKIVNKHPLTLRCVYCEHGFEPKFVASAEWHEGKLEFKKFHGADSHWASTIHPENLIVFNTEEEALAHGFKPSHFTGGHH